MYLDMFQRYGHPSTEADENIRVYLRRPDQLRTPEEVRSADASAAEYARRAAELVENLTDYRRALAERYSQLETMPYKLRLELTRRKYYQSGVVYTVSIIKTYSDGTEVQELREQYPGKQRHVAIARYETLRKLRPGIEAVKDIEKGAWER